MAETLYGDRQDAGARVDPPAPRPLLPMQAGRAKPRPAGLLASVRAALDDRRGFVLLPFGMIGGLMVAASLPNEPQVSLLAAGAVLLCVGLAVSARSLALTRIMVALVAVWLGFCLLPIHGALFGTQMLVRPAYGTYQARVDEILSETQSEKRVILSAISPVGDAREVPVRRARVVVRAGPDLSPGDVIEGAFRFAPVPGPIYPGGFDTQFHAYFDGIGSYGTTTKPPVIVTTGSETTPEHVIDAVRRGISARVDAVLAQPAAGIARAIINGDQSAVTDEAREVMSTAGIAHVLSVSGLHLTIVAGGVFAALRLLLSGWEGLATRVSVKRVAAAAGIAAAVLYFAISGGNVAAFRSTLMILLVFGAVLFGRRALTMRNVAIAGIIVVATDPASVFRPSFQLSFAAVLALVGAYEMLRNERLRDANFVAHAWAYGKGIVVSSLVAGAATLLFSVYHFQQTSPLGVLGNLLSLPLVGFVMMPAAGLAVLAMPFGLEGPFLSAMGWSIERMLDMARLVAGWSTHLGASPLLTPLALVIGLVALGWFAFFRDRWRLLGPALALPLVVLLAVDRPPDVLIADTTQAMAVRGSTGLELADGKPKSFALDVWRETYAEPIEIVADVSCDSVACIGESAAGFSYAIVADPAGFAEECGRDLIVTRIRAPSFCTSGVVIDADDLDAHGVHWLRWNAASQDFEMRPAIGSLERPWRVRP
jgi:competence protein ComEC